MTPEVRLLLDLLDEAFDKKSWHGPNLRYHDASLPRVGKSRTEQ